MVRLIQSISQRSLVSISTETHYNALRQGRQIRIVSKRLALIDVREVHLDKRNRHPGQSITNGNARVCVSAGIDNDGVDSLGSGLGTTIYQSALALPRRA